MNSARTIVAMTILLSITSELPCISAEVLKPPRFDRARFKRSQDFGKQSFDRRMMDKYNYPYQTVEDLMNATRSNQLLIRRISLDMLTERIGDQAKGRLNEVLSDPEVTVRILAASLLASLGDPNGYPQLVQDFEEQVRQYEQYQMVISDANLSSAVPSPTVRRTTPLYAFSIAALLARFGDTRGFDFTSRLALEGKDRLVRYYAFRSLVQMSSCCYADLVTAGHDPDNVFLRIAATETDGSLLRDLVGAAASGLIGGQAHEQILDTIFASSNAPDQIKAEAKEWKQIRQRALERQKTKKDQAKPDSH